MKVAISTKSLQDRYKPWGIGVYTKNLLQCLRRVEGVSIQEFSDISEVLDADVVHYPVFDFFRMSMPFRKRFPTVVTVHDITPLLFPKHYPPGVYGRIFSFVQKNILGWVDAIITDSDSSRADIEKVLGVSAKKIFKVYLGVDGSFRIIKDQGKLRIVAAKYKLPEKFLVYVGNVNWNKNILSVAKASVELGIDLYLVGKNFTSRDNLDHPELTSFKAFLQEFEGNPLVHMLGFVPEEDLIGILNLGSCLLMPSYYEGFALPILEAQACGLPVVTSNVSSMPEVAGKGAVLVDPNDLRQIVSCVKKTFDNRFRRQLVDAGCENVKRFSWEKCAEETLGVYTVSKSA